MALGTDYIIRYLSDIKGAVDGAKQVEAINIKTAKNIQDNYGQAVKIIGKLPEQTKFSIIEKGEFAGSIKQVTTLGEVVETTKGKFLQFTEVQTKIGGKLLSTSKNVADVTSQFKQTGLETAKASKWFSDFGNNIKQLAGRAILTIPVWLALRAAIMGFFGGIRSGFSDLIKFDLELQKIRNNLQGTAREVDASFRKIRTAITQASKESGISTEELAGAVKQFATLGFSAEESLQGALGASRLSIALFGDASETAGAFAKALNILIDRSAGAKSAVDQMNEAFALTSQLEETNNFEIKNVTEALDKFAGTAAGVGLTMNQTLAILAALGTAGRQGSEGATLLSTSFNQLLSNIPKISKSLGIVVGAGEDTFTIFKKIIDKIAELNQTPVGKTAAISAIGDIFGGARGIKIVQSLIAVKDILDKNIATLPSFSALLSKVDRTMNSESRQAEILGNKLKEMSKAFVSAALGSEDFTKSLVQINRAITGLTEGLKGAGTLIHAIFDNLGLVAGTAFLIKFKAVTTVQALLSNIIASEAAVNTALAGFGFRTATSFSTSFLTVLRGIISPMSIIAAVGGKILADSLIDSWAIRIRERNQTILDGADKIIDGMKGKLSNIELTSLIENLTLKLKPGDLAGAKEIGALRKKLEEQMNKEITIKPNVNIEPTFTFKEQQDFAKKILENYIQILSVQGASNTELQKARILGIDQLQIVEDTVALLNNQYDLSQNILIEQLELNKIRKQGMINTELKLLEIQGASRSEIIQTRIELEKIAKQNQDITSLTKNRLELDEAIRVENAELGKIGKNQLIENQLELLRLYGATEVQLLQHKATIEKMNGIGQGREDLLRKELSLNQEITKEKLNQNRVSSDYLKIAQIAQKYGVSTARKATEFLRGEAPIEQFQRGGSWQELMPILQEFFAAQVEQQQAQKFFFEGAGIGLLPEQQRRVTETPNIPLESIRLPEIKTQIDNININVKKILAADETTQLIIDTLAEAVRTNEEIKRRIGEISTEKIEEF
jgi:TP901 family phage tail tape measure protein